MNLAVPEKLCQLRDRLSSRIGATRYRTWFGDAARFLVDGQQVTVVVANAFVRSWIVSNYTPALEAAAREVIGSEARVQVAVDEGSAEDEPEPRGGAPVLTRPGKPTMNGDTPQRNARVPLRGEFETFIVGASNQLAYSAAQRLADGLTGGYAPLVLHGGCGLGKTHLLQAVCNAVARKHPTRHWRYGSGEEFTNEFIAALRGGRVEQFRTQQRGLDLLVVDDIHFLANKKATQEEFLHTFNAIAGSGKAVVFSSDRHPREIATLSEPLINRLISGVVVEVRPPDFAMRQEILRRRAAKMGLELAPEAIEFVARHVTRNMRELEGTLYKIAALGSLSPQGLTLDLVKLAVEDYATKRRTPDVPAIEKTVAEHFSVTSEQIRSKSRDRTVALARAVSVYLVRKHTHMSFPEIGRLLGSRNHSTVLMATQRVEVSLRENEGVSWKTPQGTRAAKLRELVAAIERSLAGE